MHYATKGTVKKFVVRCHGVHLPKIPPFSLNTPIFTTKKVHIYLSGRMFFVFLEKEEIFSKI
jgi:hypothetical protein